MKSFHRLIFWLISGSAEVWRMLHILIIVQKDAPVRVIFLSGYYTFQSFHLRPDTNSEYSQITVINDLQ